MTGEPRGVYRTLGTDEKPNSALVESGTLGFEISEQEYRDQGTSRILMIFLAEARLALLR